MRKLLIVLAAFAFVVAYTVPTFAADWSMYGSSRISTFWDTLSDKRSATGESNTDVTWNQQGNSRIGANVKAGEVNGRFEYGTGVNVRLLYGTWKWLLVGQTYTPVNDFASNQVWQGDRGLLPHGGIYNGRRPMLQGTFGGLKLALVQPVTGDVVAAATSTDVVIPMIQAKYTLKAGPAPLIFLGGYNTYQEEDTVADETYSISSYIVGFGFRIGAGPATIKGNISYGQKTTNMGQWQSEAGASAMYNAADDDIDDATSLGYVLAVAFKAGPTLTIEVGASGAQHESDLSGSETDDVFGVYANAKIDVAKVFFIVPEIGYVDYGDNLAGAEEGTQTYFGAKWQINF